MSREEEKQFLVAARDMVEAATGQRPIGYNCNWLRRGPNTLSLLQELGYVYHIDDLSRDEPFIEQVNGKDFVVVPYTLRNNDILLIEGRNYSPAKFIEQIKMDFDQLYEEAGHRRRMMSVSAHDRISGSPQMVRPGMSSCATPRVSPGLCSFARTRSRATHWKASSRCESAKPFDENLRRHSWRKRGGGTSSDRRCWMMGPLTASGRECIGGTSGPTDGIWSGCGGRPFRIKI